MHIRERIREELHTDASLQPADVSRRVLATLDAQEKMDALSVALPVLVREVIVASRYRVPELVVIGGSNAETSAETTNETNAAEERPALPSRAARSWKRQAIREAWRRELDSVYATVEGYKPLAEFSVENLDATAALLREQAAASTASAIRFEQLARAVRDAGVSRVGDLDEDTLRVRLGGAS